MPAGKNGDDMDSAMDWIRDHKTAFLGLVGALMVVIAIAMGVTSGGCTATEPASSGSSEKPDPQPAELDDGVNVSYSEPQKQVLSILEGCKWGGTGMQGRLEVTDGELIEMLPTANGADEVVTPYRIGEVSSAALPADLADSDSVQGFTLIDEETGTAHVAYLVSTLVETPDGSTGSAAYYLASSIFEGSGYYTNDGVAAELEVTGLDDRTIEALGGDEAAIEDILRAYALSHDTTAFECRWDQTLSYDYAAGSISAGFQVVNNLSEEPQMQLVVTYRATDDALEVHAS